MLPLILFMSQGNAQNIHVWSCLDDLCNGEFLEGGLSSFNDDVLIFGPIVFCHGEEKLSLISLPRF